MKWVNTEAATRGVLQKRCSQNFHQIHWKTPCSFIKRETLKQVFSCEFCEISKNTFFIEHLWWQLLAVSGRCPVEKMFLKITQFFQENSESESASNFILKRASGTESGKFQVNFAKFLRTLFSQDTSGGCFHSR